jgi:hypothetical protein
MILCSVVLAIFRDQWILGQSVGRPKQKTHYQNSFASHLVPDFACIGKPFARMEGVLLIATIAQRWEVRLLHGHPVALLPRFTLRPK